MKLTAFYIVMAACASASGCARGERIPTYAPANTDVSLRIIDERSKEIQSVSGEGAITLLDEKGDSVRLDAAFVFAPPDRARVRAWKFGQAVLDLTVTTDGVFLFSPRRNGGDEQLRSDFGQAAEALREWIRLIFGPVTDASFERAVTGSQIVLTQRRDDGTVLIVNIDRATLTPRRYVQQTDQKSPPRFVLTLTKYGAIGNAVWPMRVAAASDTGRIVIDMRDVELNVADDTAFNPPKRAERLP